MKGAEIATPRPLDERVAWAVKTLERMEHGLELDIAAGRLCGEAVAPGSGPATFARYVLASMRGIRHALTP